jgi:hypothetical protein
LARGASGGTEEAIAAGPVWIPVCASGNDGTFLHAAIKLMQSGGKAELIDANFRDTAAIAEKIAR